MNVLVDTSVWSLALRRTEPIDAVRLKLQELILDGRAAIIGPVRQELLSGVKLSAQFEALREKLRAFTDIELQTEDHEEAARFFNRCRTNGIQGSNTDFLICAVAARRELPIFTTDMDFQRFAGLIPISLFDQH
ncbi:MAG: PIN domain-containing protein [Acidobacteriota bacterium]